MGLALLSVICICMQHCILLCIDIFISYIVFICISLVSVIDDLYINTAIRYLLLVFPVSSPFLFVPHLCGPGKTDLFLRSSGQREIVMRKLLSWMFHLVGN